MSEPMGGGGAGAGKVPPPGDTVCPYGVRRCGAGPFRLCGLFTDGGGRRRLLRSARGGGGSGAGARGVGARGRGGGCGGGHALAFLLRGCREDRSHSRGCPRMTHSHRVSPSSRRRARRHARPGAHRGTAAADAARSSVHGVVVELLVHAPRERVCVHGESPCVVPRADRDVLAHDAFQADDAGGHAVAEGRQQGVRVRSELLRRLRVDDEGRVRESRGWGGEGGRREDPARFF